MKEITPGKLMSFRRPGLSFRFEPNGAMLVLGSIENIEAFAKRCNRHGYYPAIDVSASVDGVERPDYPRITVHPSIMARR